MSANADVKAWDLKSGHYSRPTNPETTSHVRVTQVVLYRVPECGGQVGPGRAAPTD